MEEQLLEFAAKAVNMKEEDIKQLLTEDADGGLETLNGKYATHIKSIKDAGYKSAERKINATWEGKLTSTFGIQSDTKGPELIDEVNEALEAKQQEQKPAKEITEAQIKKHPDYLKLEKALQEAEKTYEEKLKKTVAEKEEAFQQERLFVDVKQKGLQLFKALEPLLSEDPIRAANQEKVFLRELENFNYQKHENDLILLDKETGERLNNKQGHPVRFEDVVKDITLANFDIRAAEPRASTGRKPEEASTKPAVTVPKSREEYAKFLDSDATPQEKKEVMELYHSQS